MRAKQGKRRIIRIGKRSQQTRPEAAVGPGAINNRRQSRTVVNDLRGLAAHALAAAAQLLVLDDALAVHLPPSMCKTKMPWSRRLGSLSHRAISSRPIVS